MKTYMPLNGLRWSRNSGSANCDMPQSAVFGRPGGCSIDRCQLYLYRALEYYINSENPDMDKCKWWYWKDDYFYPSPCGARCVICPSFPKECKGCRNIKGRVFWTQYTGDTVCPIWKCCSEYNRENCGSCPDLPCARFMKDPTISDEENEANLKQMIDNLSEFVK